MLHGVGADSAGSRWYDKSFNLIVAANGTAAVNFEHAWGDGVAVMRYVNEVFDDSSATSLPFPPGPTGGAAPQQLRFELDEGLAATVRRASEAQLRHISTLSIRVGVTFIHYGANRANHLMLIKFCLSNIVRNPAGRRCKRNRLTVRL
jgi:hypothetical protein